MPVGVHVEDEQIAILSGAHLNLGASPGRKRLSSLIQSWTAGSSGAGGSGGTESAGAPARAKEKRRAEIMAPPRDCGYGLKPCVARGCDQMAGASVDSEQRATILHYYYTTTYDFCWESVRPVWATVAGFPSSVPPMPVHPHLGDEARQRSHRRSRRGHRPTPRFACAGTPT